MVVKHLLAINRRLKPLNAVINAPVITPDGDVLDRPGYDPKTKLYLDMREKPPTVPKRVDEATAHEALTRLMVPFNEFCVASAQDRGVLLAAVLTAVLRPVLPTAPAIGLDAPVQGTGKTLLALCLGALATGAVPAVYPHTAGRDDEEVRKRLTSILATGTRVIVWDNVLGHFDSAAIAALLTSQTYSDRVLGKSETATLPNKALFLITGNNLSLAGDMPRRVLTCRLDAQMDNPAFRKFDGNPLEYIRQHRQELVCAALTLVRGYQQSEAANNGGAVPGETTASFEEWDALVRQPVAWVAQSFPGRYADAGEALKEAVNNDPETADLGEIHKCLLTLFGTREFTAKEMVAACGPAPFADFADDERRAAADNLRQILEDVLGHRLNPRSVGRYLGYRVGRMVDGQRLVSRSRKKTKHFRLEVPF